jgi:adenine-specific DNA-methyltransferase
MTIEKLDATTPDLTRQNIERLLELFPECRKEGTRDDVAMVDFDLLRQALSDYLVEGPQERYRLDWPGKRQALLTANSPIDKTLRPMREDSVDFDTTRNLFIEGDNLEALKLLQETYLGKVKVIYIDPPYNTGKDFIYKDNFAQSRAEYEEDSGQRDVEGGRLVANPESNGRFHSDWLSMMYPRIKLARNLLAQDGVLFFSIADDELANSKRLLDEIFGEDNFIDTIVVEMSTTSGPKTVNAQQGQIVKNSEFAHVYRKSEQFDAVPHTPLLDGVTSFDTHYTYFIHEDGSLGSLVSELELDAEVGADIKKFGFMAKEKLTIKDLDRLLVVSDSANKFIGANLERIARVDRAPVSAEGRRTQVGRWEAFEVDHRQYLITTLESGSLQALIPLSLNYRNSDDYKPRFGRSVIRGDLWKGFHQDMGNVAKEGGTAFPNGKKPIRLIKQLMKWANNSKNGIVLDFFAGSATTAQAIFQQNAEDGGARQFILVQLDEEPDPKSDAAKAGYNSIAQVSRERIRRAANVTFAEKPELKGELDTGFRAFRIDSGNYIDTRVTPANATQAALAGMVSHIKDDRSEEDLLFGALLRWGVDITLEVEKRELAGRTVWLVDAPDADVNGPALIACFARPKGGKGGVDAVLADAIAALAPLRVLFRDDGFADDATMENVHSRFKQLAPDTEIKVL